MNNNETRFVSLDTSTTCSGLALYVDGKLKDWVKHDRSTNKDPESRMYEMAALITGQLEKWKPDIVYIETPQGHGANVKLARNLGEMLGSVLGWCALHGVEFHEINPSQWRSWCGWNQGKKTRPELKKMSIEEVKKRHGIDEGDDVADAINLGYGVLMHFEEMEIFE